MASPSASLAARPAPEPGRAGRRRVRLRVHTRRLLLLATAVAVGVAALAIGIARLASSEPTRELALPAPSTRLLLAGPPELQVIALRDDLRLYLPVTPSRITRIGYRAAGAGALPLVPVGRHENGSDFTRTIARLLGEDEGVGLGYVLVPGGTGPGTGGLDVGAAPGTDVYSPVDGAVLAITDVVRNGKRLGQRIDLQPSGTPGLVVLVSRIRALDGLTVGSSVVAARTLLGTIVDFSEVERAALSRFTQDSGQHVHLEVRPAIRPS